jgi:hypothetical protein
LRSTLIASSPVIERRRETSRCVPWPSNLASPMLANPLVDERLKPETLADALKGRPSVVCQGVVELCLYPRHLG